MSYHFNRLSVLVVEDTAPMQQLLVAVLETLGVGRIYQAGSAKTGYEIYRKENPDIIITDWQMQPATGIELVKHIRTASSSPNRTVPIIMITGYSAFPRVELARDCGVTEFLVKPFTATDLAKRIAHIINRPRDFIETQEFFGPDRRRATPDKYSGPFRRDSDI